MQILLVGALLSRIADWLGACRSRISYWLSPSHELFRDGRWLL